MCLPSVLSTSDSRNPIIGIGCITHVEFQVPGDGLDQYVYISNNSSRGVQCCTVTGCLPLELSLGGLHLESVCLKCLRVVVMLTCILRVKKFVLIIKGCKQMIWFIHLPMDVTLGIM